MMSSNTITAVGSYLFIGIQGSVLALDPVTGHEVWRSVIQKGSSFTSINIQHGKLFAAANGELYCLDPVNGDVLWHNKLKGLGLGIIAFSGSGLESAAADQQQRSSAAG